MTTRGRDDEVHLGDDDDVRRAGVVADHDGSAGRGEGCRGSPRRSARWPSGCCGIRPPSGPRCSTASRWASPTRIGRCGRWWACRRRHRAGAGGAAGGGDAGGRLPAGRRPELALARLAAPRRPDGTGLRPGRRQDAAGDDALARPHRTSFLLLTHLSKDAQQALGRRIVGTSRVVWKLTQPDPEGQLDRRKLWADRQGQHRRRRVSHREPKVVETARGPLIAPGRCTVVRDLRGNEVPYNRRQRHGLCECGMIRVRPSDAAAARRDARPPG